MKGIDRLMMNKEQIISTLYRVYDNKDKIESETIKDALSAIKINSLVNYLVFHEKDYTEQDKEMMSLIINILQYIYNNTDIESPITDELYDQLYAVMLSGGSTDIVGADIGSDRTIVYHKYPDLRGTLDKVHFFNNAEKPDKEQRRSITDWLITIENTIGRCLTEEEGEIEIFPKFDGVSVVFECDKNGNVERALTRGKTSKNEACEIPLFRGFKLGVYDKWRGHPFGVKTEIIMTYKNFEKFCKKYASDKPLASPRSAASSVINNIKDVKLDYLRYITIVPLRMQNFDTGEIIMHPDAYSAYPFIEGNMHDIASIESLRDKFSELRDYMSEAMGVPCDGVVLRLKDKKICDKMGRKDAINKYEVAYKFPPLAVKSIVKEVVFSTGLLGTITPVAKIEPVIMHGNKVKSISIGSMDRFEALNLRYGDEVLVKYEIIPYLSKDSTCEQSDGELIPAPTHCQYCGEPLIYDPLLKCGNTLCPCRMIGTILNYIKKLGIMNIAEATVTTLFNIGVLTCIEDLYRLDNHRKAIIELGGFGAKSFAKMLKSIDARRKVKDYELLGALGINDMGIKKFKKISFIYYLDELQEICNNQQLNLLTNIKGIGEKLAPSIMKGILVNEDLIDFLKGELEIVPTKGVDDSYSILFSKVKDKKDFEKFLSDKGYDIASGYNKNISLLIVPSLNETSDKIEKAHRDNKEIITVAEAKERFGYK